MTSGTSCKLSDIKGFIFGGYSSRFWMMRKHINQLPRDKLANLPFFCWQCISIETEHRTIDLVIRKEEDMNNFLYFLIYTLQTIDGITESGQALI